MSWQPGSEAKCSEMSGVVELVITPRERDLGGFSVKRVLPSSKRRLVGPFVFFDHMGPAEFPAGQGIDVRPHPHIGLATITWLFAGEILHRDSLGFVQPIQPGAVNWMTAGNGIVHSERSGDEECARNSVLHGIQAWIALPLEHEDTDPSFEHYPADALPTEERDGVKITLISGEAFGLKSSVRILSPQFYAEAVMNAGTNLDMPGEYPERAVYAVDAPVTIGGETLEAGSMAILCPGKDATITAASPARVMVLGGNAIDGERHIWWNFVSSSKDKIEDAKKRWQDDGFDQVPGETEFIPLPE